MRILTFIVNGKTIEQDPACDFTGLFPGKNDDISAEFIFSPEWDNMSKVVAFWSVMGNEYPPKLLDEYDACDIPVAALQLPVFKLQVLGKHRGNTLTTDCFTIYQRGGKV